MISVGVSRRMDATKLQLTRQAARDDSPCNVNGLGSSVCEFGQGSS